MEGRGFWRPLPKGTLLCKTPPTQGTDCSMGEGGWGSWPWEGRWYLCLARVLSICPFVASGGGGREGDRNERGLGWPGCLLAAAAVWGVRIVRDLG